MIFMAQNNLAYLKKYQITDP